MDESNRMFETLMDNYSRVEELVQASESSFGQMAEANEVRVESLDGQVGKLKVSMGELYTNIMSNETIKGAVKSLDSFVQGLNGLVTFVKNNAIPIFTTFITTIGLLEVALFKTKRGGVYFLKEALIDMGLNIGSLIEKIGFMKAGLIGIGVPAVAFLATSIIQEMRRATPSVETMKEKMGEVTSSIESYKTAQSNLDALNVDVSGMETMIEKINESKKGSEEQKVLIEEVNTLLQQHGSSYESLKGVIDDENLSLETRVALLKQEAELEANRTKQKMRSNLFDIDVDEGSFWQGVGKNMGIGSTAPEKMVKTVKNEVDSLIETYHQLSLAQMTAQNAEERGQQPRSVTINQIKELSEKLTSQQLKVQECMLENEKYQSQLDSLLQDGTISQSEYDELIQNHANAMAELQRITDETDLTLDVKIGDDPLDGGVGDVEIGEGMDIAEKLQGRLSGLEAHLKLDLDIDSESWAVSGLIQDLEELESSAKGASLSAEELDTILSMLKSVFKDMPSDVDTLEKAINHLSGSLSFTEDAVPTMKDLNQQFLETAEAVDEVQSMLDLFNDGIDSSDMRRLFDSDLLSDYNGALNDSVAIQEHLNNKLTEMQDAHNTAYMNMMAQDSEFWNNKMKNSQEWADFESGMMENITQLGADMLGIQQQDFANFINEKGGFRQVDLSNAENMMDAEGMMNSGLINQMLGWYSQYIQEKGGARGVDMGNITEFLNKQGSVEIRTINQLIEAWTSYYNAKKAEIQSAIRTMTGNMGNALDKIKAEGGQVYDKYDMSNYDASINSEMASIQKQINQLNQANNAMNSFFSASKATWGGVSQSVGQNSYKPSTVGSGGSGSKGSGSKGSGGSGSKGSGSGGSSSSKGNEKEVEDLELEIDRYYELNDAINTVNNALEMNRQLQKSATDVGTTKKLHEEEIKLLNEKLKAMQKLHLEQRNDMLDQKNILTSAGFNFDNEGNLTNYSSRLKELQNYANSLRGEAKAEQIEYTNSIMKTIEAYTTLANDTLPSTALSIEELTQEIKDVNKEHEKTLKLVEALGDRYYEINGLTNDVDKKLAINQAKQNNATASDRVKLMEEEIALMKEKQDLLVQQGNELKTEAKELTKKLSEQGVEFNVDGTIKNYQQLMDKYKLIASQYVGEKRDEVIEEAEEMIELIEKYDDIIRNTLPDLAVEWEEYTSSIREAEKNMAQTVTDIQKDISSAIQNELEKRTEATKTELEKQKDLYNKQFDEEDWEDSLSAEQRKLDEIQQAINNMSRDTSLAGQLKLQQLREEYEAQQKVINDMIRDKEKENGNSRFDEEMEKLDKELEEVLDPQNIADLVNKSLVDGFVTIGDEVVALDTLMTDWLTETGDGLYAIGDLLREELIDNLRVAQQLMSGIGIASIGRTAIDQQLLAREVGDKLQTALTLNGEPNQKLEIAIGSLVEVQGNVTEDVLPKLETMIETAKTELIDEIASEIMRR